MKLKQICNELEIPFFDLDRTSEKQKEIAIELQAGSFIEQQRIEEFAPMILENIKEKEKWKH